MWEVVGSYNKKTDIITKEYWRQGWIYKDPNAFYKKSNDICYVPELSDERYAYRDFLRIANGREKVAEILFDMVDWQHPETLMIEFNDFEEVDDDS